MLQVTFYHDRCVFHFQIGIICAGVYINLTYLTSRLLGLSEAFGYIHCSYVLFRFCLIVINLANIHIIWFFVLKKPLYHFCFCIKVYSVNYRFDLRKSRRSKMNMFIISQDKTRIVKLKLILYLQNKAATKYIILL